MKRAPSQTDIEIGNRIKEMRADLGISGLDLAKRLGVTRGAVGNWELGKGIKRENLQLIADAFNVSFDWLATGRGSPTAAPPKGSIDRKLKLLRPEIAEMLEDQFDALINQALEKQQRTSR